MATNLSEGRLKLNPNATNAQADDPVGRHRLAHLVDQIGREDRAAQVADVLGAVFQLGRDEVAGEPKHDGRERQPLFQCAATRSVETPSDS